MTLTFKLYRGTANSPIDFLKMDGIPQRTHLPFTPPPPNTPVIDIICVVVCSCQYLDVVSGYRELIES